MRRVLFVDDEPRILEGLRRSLRSMRHEWWMECDTGGAEALETMKGEPFDIVVADMKMPGMDGADLLTEVKRLYPQTVRIILSGHSERNLILKSIGATHQYLSKPCDADILKQTIQRADALRALLGNESIKGLVSRMNSLPSLPALFQQIVAEIQKPNVSLESIGEVIARDIAMSAKILQLVNSAYFGLRNRIYNVGRAVTHLGLETINALVLGVGVFSQYDEMSIPGFSMDSLWRHSMRSAAFARAVAQAGLEKNVADEAFSVGMLHDVGKLVLAAGVPEQYGRILERVKQDGLPVCQAENEVLEATHAEIGAYLIGLWGLPDSMVEAIAYHPRPIECAMAEFGVLTIVHVASGLARELDEAVDNASSTTIDLEYLRKLGLEDHLPVWREACREVLEGDDR